MSAPNILSLTTITGKTAGLAVTNSASAIIAAVATGHAAKVNTLIVANITGAGVSITADVYKNQATAYRIAYQITVPANSSIVLIGKGENTLYLEENDSLRLTAGANSSLEAVVSYEDLS